MRPYKLIVFAAALQLTAALPANAAPPSAQNEEHKFSSRQDQAGEGERSQHFYESTGKALYLGICQGCHMSDGKGATGAGTYPALAENPKLTAKLYPAVTIIHGRKAMPAFGDTLDDKQIAAVVNYVRSHFGNNYDDALTAAEVAKLKQ